LRLHLNGDNATFRSDQSRKFEGEKTHSWTRLQHCHVDAHEGLEHPGGIVHEFADGVRQDVADPPRADDVFGHGNNSL
jgi:hypothetical protein